LRGLVEATSDIVIGVDSEGVLTHVSSGARRLLGLDPDDWLGKPVFGLVHPEDLELAVENFVATVDLTADQSPMTVRVRHAAGERVPFEVYANNQLDDPDIAAVVISMRDVTEREQHRIALEASQEALRLAERQFRMSFDHAPIGMALVSPDGQFLEVNTALCHIVARAETELLGRTFQDITHPDDLAEDLELLSELVLGLRTDYQLDKRYLRPDGTLVWVQLNVSLIRDERDSPIHVVSQIQDITERRLLHDSLIEQANRDSLTGLASRACLETYLTDACASAGTPDSVTLVFLDLNGFKAVNDTLGHAAGDLVLRQTAERVRQAIRAGDLAARLGGDELAVVLVGADKATIEAITERLREVIAEPMQISGHLVAVGVSIGHATTMISIDPSQLLADADRAMYADKNSRLGR
jgi:diguanylate cyclase (GGDEF)-like protein/PAS domain S-box-containing protein